MTNLRFDELSLSAEIQQAIADMGFTEASPIQSQAIPFLLEGHDLIGQAQTGTGKTAAFAIPALELCQTNIYKPQVLVLCPTRELANQVAIEFKKIGKYKKGIHCLAVYGGESIEMQTRALRRGVHIVIGTPGRVIDHIERGNLDLSGVKQIILDEADEMLNMGFIDDIKLILESVPEERQTIFFSATMPPPILELTRRFQKNPKMVKVVSKQLTTNTIEQLYFKVRSEHKTELLRRLLELNDIKSAIVFCNTKVKVDELVADLQQNNINAEAIHGDLRQSQRNLVMGKFRTGATTVLIATDVAARGIDVENVEAVINYDLPMETEYYVHRIGRTGRAGKSGKSFSFVSSRDNFKLRDIERYAHITIPQGNIPSLTDVQGFRQAKFAEQIKTEIEQGGLKQFDKLIAELTEEGLDLQSITAALLKMRLGANNKQAEIALDDSDRKPKYAERDNNNNRSRGGNDRDFRGGDRDRDFRNNDSRGGRDNNRSRGSFKYENNDKTSMIRLFLNIGKQQKISKGDILGAITGEAGINGSNVGTIDIFDKYSFVNVSEIEAMRVLKVLNQAKIKGNTLNVEIAQ